ncbi:uroporphyrinogen-III synthase [Bradyrhizobium prioriisuperbiae]|uniref:uroporphyrinogen-III synthase n=1 Tax=Bradyrhizobium prioriisuperbiae TaxID=2854389 RepID=UPI0028F05FC7|nr:uroporphyrinogen-III synthase [Bradyrhizobium prioritasuperba]
MAVLVTRPHPDNVATAEALRGKGFDVLLAPMLRFEPVAFEDDGALSYDGVIVTSANALRAIDAYPGKSSWLSLPLFAVGAHTADAARATGFQDIIAGNSGAAGLPDLIAAHFDDQKKSGNKSRKKSGKTSEKASDTSTPEVLRTLLYLAGADRAHDLTDEMDERGFHLVCHTTYAMVPIARLPAAVCDAFAADDVEAILHYSRRSARAFVTAARADGVEISALALPQCCLSESVAAVMRDAGASRVVVARNPDEKSMLDAVERALRPQQR